MTPGSGRVYVNNSASINKGEYGAANGTEHPMMTMKDPRRAREDYYSALPSAEHNGIIVGRSSAPNVHFLRP